MLLPQIPLCGEEARRQALHKALQLLHPTLGGARASVRCRQPTAGSVGLALQLLQLPGQLGAGAAGRRQRGLRDLEGGLCGLSGLFSSKGARLEGLNRARVVAGRRVCARPLLAQLQLQPLQLRAALSLPLRLRPPRLTRCRLLLRHRPRTPSGSPT